MPTMYLCMNVVLVFVHQSIHVHPPPPPTFKTPHLHFRWHNGPREREGKECGEADGHGGLQRERPREGKGEGRGKVRARRKRKVKGW